MPPEPEDVGDFLERHRPYLLMLARMQINPKMRPRDGPSDVVQETLLRAYQRLGQFHGDEAALRAWLHGILANVIAEVWRKNVAAKRDINREEAVARLEDSSGRLQVWLAANGLAPASRRRRMSS